MRSMAHIDDADIEQAAWEALGARIHALQQDGVCIHGSAIGAGGDPDLIGGQLRCTDGCGRVFGSEEEWLDALAEATE